MNKNNKLLLVLGIITVIVPFLGFSEVVGSTILFIVGVILIISALVNRGHECDTEGSSAAGASVINIDDGNDEVKQVNLNLEEGQEIEISVSDDHDDEEEDDKEEKDGKE